MHSTILKALQEEKSRIPPVQKLFTQQPQRAEKYSLEAAGWYLDYSRHRASDKVMELLFELAREAEVPRAIQQMYEGHAVNASEGRAALHTVLRLPRHAGSRAIAEQLADVHACRQKMYRMADRLRTGEWTGHRGRRIRNLVHIGTGGSHLGPETVYEALGSFRQNSQIQVHFAANLDGAEITHILGRLDPEETVVSLVSKSFTTLEVMKNAEAAKHWLANSGVTGEGFSQHLLAVTANTDAALDFGIDPDNLLPMWDWVGGRYSLWSAVGIPLVISLGAEHFESLLSGARAMDQHFASAQPEVNMPVLLGLLGIWYNNIWGAGSHAVLPYDHGLRLLPSHLQQLEMESSGKSVTQEGRSVTYHTGPVVWGGEGTNGQHAFHQLLHQGTRLIPVDFICAARPGHDLQDHHDWLIANCLAQAEALTHGRSEQEVQDSLIQQQMPPEEAAAAAMHRKIRGNKPCSILMTEVIDPASVGALIALYEHKVFVQGCIWHINSFDQWGVELGKQLAADIHKYLTGGQEAAGRDPSTLKLISRYRRLAGKQEKNS